MTRFERPRRFEIYKANAHGLDFFALVLSDDIANALRSVVVVCSLEPLEKGMNLDLPTIVRLSPSDTSLSFDTAASPGSPITLPKNALVEGVGRLSVRTRRAVDEAFCLVFGYADWPGL